MSRLAKRRPISHDKTAARLRSHPRMWMPVGEYRSSQSAEHMAWAVRTAYPWTRAVSAYEPAGAYEARVRLTEFGAELVARYVGGAS
jgi:hypothetical protein